MGLLPCGRGHEGNDALNWFSKQSGEREREREKEREIEKEIE